ncbi:uncharacterized protein PHALS_03230 [Plasmopara halstedii]|uniref:Uncharacterized protein n=1 Tax=Plasmopara halstedii TaxID=4781 RepID=A0A0P1AZ85_PLAHL|nr:uncharacterized protein PHALS_03230 [Plasmopara halstedii]CEG46632.1 hypothetical protein PHALS_03230 [Plasmopara halstedii]|eukprot:XP_024583001.1 hypothetical protein PHALS_03230 [Plasmopara halstedii]
MNSCPRRVVMIGVSVTALIAVPKVSYAVFVDYEKPNFCELLSLLYVAAVIINYQLSGAVVAT